MDRRIFSSPRDHIDNQTLYRLSGMNYEVLPARENKMWKHQNTRFIYINCWNCLEFAQALLPFSFHFVPLLISFLGGRNGYGAKLCNIFSKEFTLETSTNEFGKAFKQVIHINWATFICAHFLQFCCFMMIFLDFFLKIFKN